MIKSFKIRIYPNQNQIKLINKHFDNCRFVWNYMLNMQTENYKNGGKYINKYKMSKELTLLKKQEEYKWLKDVSATSLVSMCRRLDLRFMGFFKKSNKYPKFKSKKRSKKSYPVRASRFYFVNEREAKIEKIGNLKYKTDFELNLGTNNKFSDVELFEENGKFYITFGVKYDNQVTTLNDYKMGVDLGIKELAVISYDNSSKSIVFHNINKTSKVKKLEKQIKMLQRAINRKYSKNKKSELFVKTKNIEKQEIVLRKKYKKISNIKNNYIHQITHQLVSLLPKEIIVEDLNITGMLKNKYLSNAIYSQCFGKFLEYLEYKCNARGIKITKANRFYPSSKKCSCCGNINKELTLKDRVYKCKQCGIILDRDLNAAINLENYIA